MYWLVKKKKKKGRKLAVSLEIDRNSFLTWYEKYTSKLATE